MSAISKQILNSVFDFYYSRICHFDEDLRYELGDHLYEEFTEDERSKVSDSDLYQVLEAIVKKLGELEGTF